MGNIAVAHMTLSSYSRKRASQDVEEGMHLRNWSLVTSLILFAAVITSTAGCAALPEERCMADIREMV